MSEYCPVFVELYGCGDVGNVKVSCRLAAGHEGPHEGVKSQNRVDRPGATCQNCRGRGTLEAYSYNVAVRLTWDA